MAIREFSLEGVPRARIAFVGEIPQRKDLDRFRERNYSCGRCTPQKLRTRYASKLDAVIWTQDPDKLNALPRELGTILPNLLDHDVRVYIRLARDANLSDTPRRLVVNALQEAAIPVANLRPNEWQETPEIRRDRQNSFLSPCVYICDVAQSWADVAVLACDRPAGPSPKSGLKIDEKMLLERFGPDGHEERVMLLKRAFWNCSEVRLASLEGGMSGAPVFKAYASLDAGLVQQGMTGAYPHLYFVKIGPRKKIVAEHDKYCSHVFEYVPFHLGPRLRRDRCNLGSTQGILVGDFVEGAEPLIVCARGAGCGHAISNLFDKTLGGWRKQCFLDKKRPLRDYFAKKWLVEGSYDRIVLPPARAKIVRDLRGSTNIAALKKLFERHGNVSALIAPAHGDMHATNVLVRHGDAILIDYEKLEEDYPLTYDPASLEGGLLVEGFINDFEKGTLRPKGLVKLIERLYEQPAFKAGATTPCRPGDPTEWYYNAVNQIRTLSWSAENAPGQYALTLALCLIRKGCNTHQDLAVKAPSASRAVAFFFGQKILREMNSKNVAAQSRKKRSSKGAGR